MIQLVQALTLLSPGGALARVAPAVTSLLLLGSSSLQLAQSAEFTL